MKLTLFSKHCWDSLLPKSDKKSRILLCIQSTLFVFLAATFILVLTVDENSREILYCLLVGALALLILAAILFNLRGKYDIAALLTVIATVIGPWSSIFLDHTIFQGDCIPLIYIALSIELCAILLSVRLTVIISAFQFTALSLCIVFNEALQAINWPSLIAFIVLTSSISIVTSYLYRKQLDEINTQKAQLQKDEQALREMAVRDSLTGLYNRRYMLTALEQELNRASRSHTPLGIIMVDVDCLNPSTTVTATFTATLY